MLKYIINLLIGQLLDDMRCKLLIYYWNMKNKDDNKLGDWIKSARSHSGMSLEALGEAIGRTKQAVWSLEKGVNEPSYSQLLDISKVTGFKEPFPGLIDNFPSLSFDSIDNAPVVISREEEEPAGYIRLDYLEVESSAGKGRSVDYEMPVLHKLDVLEDWAISALGRNAQDRIKIINNVGDSMAPTIQDGDILFVDVKTTTFEAEGIYVINFNDVLLTKRLIAQADGRLAIVSDNSAVYAPQYISAREAQDLNICGRVRAWWSLRKY